MSASSSTSTTSDLGAPRGTAFGIASSLLPVRLIFLWGEAIDAALYLRDTASPSGDREGLGVRLNEPEVSFLPFSTESRTELVRVAAVAYVEHPDKLPEVTQLERLGAIAHPVETELMTGEILRGELLGFGSPDRPRLSDLLNSEDTFLPFLAGERTLYVNRDAMARVRGLG